MPPQTDYLPTADSSAAPDRDDILLRQYVRQQSQVAFSALVHRHSRLVYAACLRDLGDTHLAEDVSQVVFLLLARKAPRLLHMSDLSGWLFRTARFAASNALRQQRRQRVQEQKVVEDMIREHRNSPPVATWDLLELPCLLCGRTSNRSFSCATWKA